MALIPDGSFVPRWLLEKIPKENSTFKA